MSATISKKLVDEIAHLANIPLSDKELSSITAAFDETLQVIDNLSEIDTTGIEPAHHTTGLENIMREDVVDNERMFSQEEALSQAKKTNGGYFVVPRILHND